MTMRFCRRFAAALATLTTAAWVLAAPLRARTLETLPYAIADVWPGAVRFLRVDRGFVIREKDEAAGYVLFDFTDGPKSCKASLELIRTTDKEGRDATRVAITIRDLPRHYEQMLLDKLVSRLRDDRGAPPPPPRKPEPPKPDAGPPAPTPSPDP